MPEPAHRIRKILQQVDVNVEADDKRLIFLAQKMFSRNDAPTSFSMSSTRCWLPLESMRMPSVNGQIGFGLEILDRLRLAIFKDVKGRPW